MERDPEEGDGEGGEDEDQENDQENGEDAVKRGNSEQREADTNVQDQDGSRVATSTKMVIPKIMAVDRTIGRSIGNPERNRASFIHLVY